MTDDRDRLTHCLDCGTELAGIYCSRCGQRNVHRRLKIADIVGDVVAHFLSLDSTAFRTVGGLLRNPGRVAREYVDGRRRRYLNPFKLYITASALFFLLTRLLGIDLIDSSAPELLVETHRQATVLAFVVHFLQAHLEHVAFFTLPILAIAFRVLFRKSGYNFAETLAFLLFVSSVSYVIQMLGVPVTHLFSSALAPVRLLIRWSLLAYGTKVFYDKGPVTAGLLSFLALGIFMILTMVLMTVGVLVYFLVVGLPA